MKLEEIKKELVKQKDPLKYLESVLEKIKDKDLQEKIKKIIEKFKIEETPEKLPGHSLEGLVRHAPRVPIEQEIIPRQPEIEPERITSTDSVPSMALTVESKPSEDYGMKPGKADYDITTERVKKNLQNSNLVAEHGFTSSAETMHLIDQKMGEYNIDRQQSYAQGDQPKYQKDFEHVQENVREREGGLTSLEKQVKKGKLAPDYK